LIIVSWQPALRFISTEDKVNLIGGEWGIPKRFSLFFFIQDIKDHPRKQKKNA
jgi:hypothetical protein